jgi:hypothetical protein
VDPRVGLDDVENRKFLTLLGLELRPFGRPTRSQSLYRLRCLAGLVNYSLLCHHTGIIEVKIWVQSELWFNMLQPIYIQVIKKHKLTIIQFSLHAIPN